MNAPADESAWRALIAGYHEPIVGRGRGSQCRIGRESAFNGDGLSVELGFDYELEASSAGLLEVDRGVPLL